MNETTGARHILNDHGRITGNVFADVPANGPTVCVKTAAGGESYKQTKRFPFVKSFIAGCEGHSRDEATDHQADQ
jgi:hypothetical protein